MYTSTFCRGCPPHADTAPWLGQNKGVATNIAQCACKAGYYDADPRPNDADFDGHRALFASPMTSTSTGPGHGSGLRCAPCTAQCGAYKFAAHACNATHDLDCRACRLTTSCKAGQYLYGRCSPLTDYVCQARRHRGCTSPQPM